MWRENCSKFPKIQISWNTIFECKTKTILQHERIVTLPEEIIIPWTRKTEIGTIITSINDIACL